MALLLLVQALTGILWSNQEALTSILHPEARLAQTTRRASLDDILGEIQARAPGARLDRIALPVQGFRAVTARVSSAARGVEILLIDPATGHVLSSGPAWAYPEQFAERAHGSLLVGQAGHWVLFGEGLVLTTLSVTGLIIWWPGLARVGRALIFRGQGPSRRVLRELHLVPGALSAILLLIIGATGALMASEPLTTAIVSRFAPVDQTPSPILLPAPRSSKTATAQQAIDLLRARFPSDRLVKVQTAGPSDRMIIGVFVSRRRGNPEAYAMAGLDRRTGVLTMFADPATQPAGDAAIAWLTPVHDGRIYGPLRALISTGGGLILILMVVTGISNWVLRRRLGARRAK